MLPFIVISYACFALVIVVLIMGKKGSEEDKNLRRMKTIGKDVVKADYKNVDTSFYERNIKPFLDKMNKKGDENLIFSLTARLNLIRVQSKHNLQIRLI